MFSLLDKKQINKLHEWDDEHVCPLKEYSGAIGGRLTYCFTPTGLGVITIVKCACGEKVDLTDYGDW